MTSRGWPNEVGTVADGASRRQLLLDLHQGHGAGERVLRLRPEAGNEETGTSPASPSTVAKENPEAPPRAAQSASEKILVFTHFNTSSVLEFRGRTPMHSIT